MVTSSIPRSLLSLRSYPRPLGDELSSFLDYGTNPSFDEDFPEIRRLSAKGCKKTIILRGYSFFLRFFLHSREEGTENVSIRIRLMILASLLSIRAPRNLHRYISLFIIRRESIATHAFSRAAKQRLFGGEFSSGCRFFSWKARLPVVEREQSFEAGSNSARRSLRICEFCSSAEDLSGRKPYSAAQPRLQLYSRIPFSTISLPEHQKLKYPFYRRDNIDSFPDLAASKTILN